MSALSTHVGTPWISILHPMSSALRYWPTKRGPDLSVCLVFRPQVSRFWAWWRTRVTGTWGTCGRTIVPGQHWDEASTQVSLRPSNTIVVVSYGCNEPPKTGEWIPHQISLLYDALRVSTTTHTHAYTNRSQHKNVYCIPIGSEIR